MELLLTETQFDELKMVNNLIRSEAARILLKLLSAKTKTQQKYPIRKARYPALKNGLHLNITYLYFSQKEVF